MKATPTPTPWRQNGPTGRATDSVFPGRPIFTTWVNGDDREANAALIVAAVNSYAARAELIEALEAMVDRWEPDTEGADRRMWENARRALARAKGGDHAE